MKLLRSNDGENERNSSVADYERESDRQKCMRLSEEANIDWEAQAHIERMCVCAMCTRSCENIFYWLDVAEHEFM